MSLLHDFYRSRLNERGKVYYDGLSHDIRQLAIKGQTYVPGKFDQHSLNDLFAAYYALREDRPEYYFLSNRIHSSRSESGVILSQEVRFTENHILRINQLLRRAVSDAMEGCKEKTVLERERLVYSRIAKQYTYAENDLAQDVSGLLIWNSGVCEALASFLVLTLRETGIPAIKLKGYGRKSLHSWCVALINGRAMHLDVTWDLSSKGDPSRFRYFNLTEDEIKRDHTLLLDEYQHKKD